MHSTPPTKAGLAEDPEFFALLTGVIWQLMNESGITFGQAAVFRSWRDI
jgi:hypothetical protein